MTTPLDARVAREHAAHTEQDVLAESERLKERFSHIYSYPSRRRLHAYMDALLADVAGKDVLDLGCGRGQRSLRLLQNGAQVQGIDISENYVAVAAQKAREAGYNEAQFTFQTMDAHHLAFPDHRFDIVVGDGILHHLDYPTALREVYRVLKPGGRVLFFEPLADNPLLKLFRRFTPNARTEDERPFDAADLQHIAELADWRVENRYCGMLEAPAAMFTSIALRPFPNNPLLRLVDLVERGAHRAGLLPAWNQYVLFSLVKR